MRICLKYMILLAIALASTRSYGGDKDSAKVKKDSFLVNYFYKKNLDTSITPYSVKVSNSLTGIQIYNPIYEHNFFPVTLGNLGLATKSLIFNPNEQTGFDLGMHSFDDYLFTDENIRYYQVRSPYSELKALLGAKKEQMIEIKHYQNIKKLFNLGLDYRVIGSLGEYSREKADLSNFRFSGSYFSKNKKYLALANFILNRIKTQENGGILSVNGLGAQTLDSLNLNNAQNHLRQSEINVKQYFRIGSRKPEVGSQKSERKKGGSFKQSVISERRYYKAVHSPQSTVHRKKVGC